MENCVKTTALNGGRKLAGFAFLLIAATIAPGAHATDFTLAQGGKWSDPETWGLTEGYPNSTSDTITIPDTIAAAVTINLDASSSAD